MIKFALFGAGRIGALHAENISDSDEADLYCVYDVNKESASNIANKHNSKIISSPDEALANNEVDAVLIASSTDTHVDLIIKSSKANKHIFCEKPIDLSIDKVEKCREEIKDSKKIIQIGFNRRYDSSFAATKQSLIKGEIGDLEKIIISSRDPAPPTADYIKVSGGIFRDMMIHDFDLSRFVLGDDPITEVFARGSVLFDENCKNLNDFDTAMVLMKSKKGVLININNSRRSIYGYDQRLEIFGNKGMVLSDNQTATSVKKFFKDYTNSKDPILNFFIDRYGQAYKDELKDFITSISQGKSSKVDFEDGRQALILADAANKSIETGKVVLI